MAGDDPVARRSCAARCGAPAARSPGARRWPRSRRASASTRAPPAYLRTRCASGASGSPRTEPTARRSAASLRRALARGLGLGGRLARAVGAAAAPGRERLPTLSHMESVYDLYRRGMALLEAGDHHAAAVALCARARPGAGEDLDPRGARPGASSTPRATRRPGPSSRPSSSARRPTTTRCSASGARCSSSAATPRRAGPLALAACLRPERSDYRLYRDRAALATARAA